MIRYKDFDFAAPILTNVDWFMSSMQIAGLSCEGSKTSALKPFSMDVKKILRVSLVRHPYDWLLDYYRMLKGTHYWTATIPAIEKFISYRKDSFKIFIDEYVEKSPGVLSNFFSLYAADTCLRMEDFPWAIYELLESLGKYGNKSYFPQKIGNSGLLYEADILHKIVESEKEFCEHYDYY
jgi:hypothetical protein